MLEKAERFKEGEAGPDTFGLYDVVGRPAKENKRPRTALAPTAGGALAPERVRMQMDDLKHRLQSTHEKALASLQAKLQRAETAATAAKAEVGQLKTDLRTSHSSLTTLTAQLAKTDGSLKKHQTLLPSLQSKLDELTTSHAASHARKDAAIAELKQQLAQVEASLLSSSSDLASARADLDAQSSERALLAVRNDILVSALDGARQQLANAATLLASRAADHASALSKADHESYLLTLRTLHLERQLGDKSAVISALGSYSAAVDEQLAQSVEFLADRESELEIVRKEWSWERNARNGGDKEWRQRSRSEKRELDMTLADVAFECEVREAERTYAEILRRELEEERQERASEVAVLLRDLEVAEGELEIALGQEIPRIEEERDDMKAKVEEMEAECEDLLKEVERGSEVAEKLREVESATRGELEEAQRVVRDREKTIEKERTEKKAYAKLVGQSRAAEAGLREELEAVTNAFEELLGVQSQNAQLSRTVDELARRNTLAEADARELGDLNTDLLSHGNANQRIRHVAQIRQELDQSRRSHLATTSALATTQRENAALREELQAYRSVSSVPVRAAGRSKLLRTSGSVDDAANDADEDKVEDLFQLGGGAMFGLGTLEEATEPFEDEEEELFALPSPPPPNEDEQEDSYAAPPPMRAGRASVTGSKKAGRMPAGAGGGKAAMGGARRQTGYMSVSELI
ncbi:hypothetical protein RQP46_004399 [Phenoliferia psychrophenolica]